MKKTKLNKNQLSKIVLNQSKIIDNLEKKIDQVIRDKDKIIHDLKHLLLYFSATINKNNKLPNDFYKFYLNKFDKNELH